MHEKCHKREQTLFLQPPGAISSASSQGPLTHVSWTPVYSEICQTVNEGFPLLAVITVGKLVMK